MVNDEYLLKIGFFCFPDDLLTSSLHLYADKVFEPSRRSSLGVDIPTKHIKLANKDIKLILTNISTDPHFTPKCLYYFRGASAAVFVFSKSNRSFFDSTRTLVHEFYRHISDLPITFIGLQDDPEVVTFSEGQSFSQELGADYFEMAVDDLQALDKIIRSLSQKIIALKTSRISIFAGVDLQAIILSTKNGLPIYSQYFGTTQNDEDTVGSILISIQTFSNEILSYTSLVERGLKKAKEQGTELTIKQGEHLIGIAVVDHDNQVTEQEEDTLTNWLLNFITDVEEECAQELAELPESIDHYNFRKARRVLQTKIDLLFKGFIGQNIS